MKRLAVMLAAFAVVGRASMMDATPMRAVRVGPPPRSPRSALRAAIDSMANAAEFRNAHWGILIVDPVRGDTLYSRNAGKLFMPASNMKLVTAAVALTTLGPTYRFRTTFATDGRIADGVLGGSLWIIGRGDPTLSAAANRGEPLAPFRDIADSLLARGVHRIAGSLSAVRVFPDPDHGYGWSWDDFAEDYSAGVTELMFNEGAFRLTLFSPMYPGRSTAPDVWPPIGYPTLAGTIALGDPNDSAHVTDVHVMPLSRGSDTVRFTGRLAPGRTAWLNVAYPDQRAAYLAALRTTLVEKGITIGEGTASAPAATPPHLDTLFATLSRPLADILPLMQKPSQNQIAELLLRTVALERAGVASADSGAAIVGRQLIAWGAQPDGFIVKDGSGLSRYDYLSPETLIHVLAAARRDSSFSAYYDALPIAGVDGSIAARMKGTVAQGNVHAKTGSLANARSLSGYVTTVDGRTLLFTALCNNWTTARADVERVQDSIATRLASLDERRRKR